MEADSLFSINGCVIIVTGAARGNGRAILDGIRRSGGVAVGLDLQQGEAGDTDFFQCDLMDWSSVKTAVDSIIQRYGRLDGLVNNAGISLESKFPYKQEDELNFRKMFEVNLYCAFKLSSYCAAYLAQSERASIINVTSLGAHFAFKNNPWYQISKAGLSQATKSLAIDLCAFGIRVNSIVPGYIHTKMTEKSFNDEELSRVRMQRCLLDRWGQSNDLVGPVIFLLSRASSYVNGTNLVVDGGWSVSSGV